MTLAKLSDVELQYLRDWIRWIDRGAPESPIFSRRHGLCAGFHVWHEQVRPDSAIESENFARVFRREKKHSCFPFSTGPDPREYFYYEQHERQMHQNPRRIEWVRKKLEIKGPQKAGLGAV